MEYLTEMGYAGMFIAAFLAATILPFSSEAVLGFLLLHDFDPLMTVAVATAGNVLGSFTNYAIGYWGGTWLIHKVLRMDEKELAQATSRFRKYGIWSLLFAWVPVIGDPLTVVAGTLKVNFALFTILVTAGKLARYIIIAISIC